RMWIEEVFAEEIPVHPVVLRPSESETVEAAFKRRSQRGAIGALRHEGLADRLHGDGDYSVNVRGNRQPRHVISSAAMRAAMTSLIVLASVTIAVIGQAPPADVGRAAFERNCARCHGADGQGGEMGPGITTRVA